jgi:hypothetical protein
MSVRKTALAAAILRTVVLSLCLGFAQAPSGMGDSRIKVIRQQLVVAPDYRAVVTGQGDVEPVHIELWHKGHLVDQDSNPPSGVRWWEGAEPIKGYLLNPQQTPWSVAAVDRYEELRPSP